MLERMAAADRGDFHSASKLRLLRVYRSMCSPRAFCTLGLELTVLSQVDALLYEVLGDNRSESIGHNRREAAKLSALLDHGAVTL